MDKKNSTEVRDLINTERAYQDKAWSTHDSDDSLPRSVGEELLLLEHYHAVAREELNALGEIRKIAAIAVRCLETHGGSSGERLGALPRERVFALLEEEVSVQVCRDPVPTVAWELAMIGRLLQLARESWAVERDPKLTALYRVREVGGAALRCLANHGAPARA